uniref:Protein FLX-like 1 n=1 Tax=Oryza barthii TaxID=65489 RepID=A0A0D3GRF8_9ORYZ
MAGRHRNPPPPSFPRGGGGGVGRGHHPPPPSLHHHRLPPPHHLDDFREPPLLPPHHHLDDFREPHHLPPPHHHHHLDEFGEPPRHHNQRLAATHVALVQEVSAVRHELGRTARGLAAAQEEGELRLREVYERSMKMEAELRAVEEMRAELAQVHLDIQKLGAARQELMGQVQGFTQDLARSAVDLQQVAALKAEIQEIRHETQHLRSGIEVEKKGYAESYEQGQEMQKKLISVASEVEKLRAEAEKRSRAAVSGGNQVYVGGYGNPKAAYAANPYNAGYNINQPHPQANTADSGSQFGPGSTHAPWGAYDMQRATGRR